jgi:hypothetical protein
LWEKQSDEQAVEDGVKFDCPCREIKTNSW